LVTSLDEEDFGPYRREAPRAHAGDMVDVTRWRGDSSKLRLLESRLQDARGYLGGAGAPASADEVEDDLRPDARGIELPMREHDLLAELALAALVAQRHPGEVA
jgi:hypothetical protein